MHIHHRSTAPGGLLPAVGEFDLVSPVARGASGTVWQAFHRPTGERAAVKVLGPAAARDELIVRAFRAEVQAVARLDHPHVVRVLDDGRVPAGSTELPPGAPWLAMEWVGGGVLRPEQLGSWEEVADLAAALLSALAHAHARGVLHRDLKPGNVLRAAPGDGWPGPRLADFGGAGWREGRRGRDMVGTPLWMPPERLRGAWWEEGPASDLYAVALITWYALTGRMPHGGDDRDAAVDARLAGRLLPLAPRFPVPDGAEAWLRALLRPRVAARPRSAAAALAGLLRLPDGHAAPGPGRPVTGLEAQLRRAMDEAGSALPADPCALPPPPRDWRRRVPVHPRSPAARLDLRARRLGGRDVARDRLWAALRRAHHGDGPGLVVLRGPSGMGRTWLAEWLAEAAEELGAAEPLRARHLPDGGQRHGLGPMLSRWLGVSGAGTDGAAARVEGRLAAEGIDLTDAAVGLSTLLAPGEGRRLGHPDERRGLVQRLLLALSRQRVVLVLLDDLQWGAEARALVQALLVGPDEDRPRRVLVVATWSTDAIPAPGGPGLDDLLALPGAAPLDVGPMAEADLRSRLQEALGLGEALAARVAARAGGSPVYALQLAEFWADRGHVIRGPDGWTLAPGVVPEAPPGPGQAWLARLAPFLDDQPRAAQALELAAVLGPAPAWGEWEAACRARALSLPRGLVDALVSAGLLLAEPDGVAFAHAMLRDALISRAASSGRLAAHHRACAEVLAGVPGVDPARLGRHRAASGAPREALDPLAAAVTRALDQGDQPRAAALLDELDAALSAAGLSDGDPRRAAPMLLRCRLLRASDDGGAGERLAGQVVQAGLRHGWGEEVVRGLIALGRHALARGDSDAALQHLSEAESRCLDLELAGVDGHLLLADVLRARAVVHLRRGELHLARTRLGMALDAMAGIDDPLREAGGLLDLSHVLLQLGAVELAEAAAEKALSGYRQAGSRWGVGNAENALGEVARARGELDAAADHYRQAARINRGVAPALALVPTVNLGLTLVLEGRAEEGRSVLVGALTDAGAAHRASLHAVVHAGLALAAVELGDAADADHHVAMVAGQLEDGDLAERDLVTLLQAVADEAADPELAARAGALAAAQRAALEPATAAGA